MTPVKRYGIARVNLFFYVRPCENNPTPKMTAGLFLALPSSGLDHLPMNMIGRFLRVKLKEQN
jgi:hypothetical protein